VSLEWQLQRVGRELIHKRRTKTDGSTDTLPLPAICLGRQAVANYIAKYVTKTLDVPGLPSTRIRSKLEITALRCPAHHQQMIATAWQLGARDATAEPRFRQWAHMLGYGGHFLTKSRRYSTTFGQLRRARIDHRRRERHPDGEHDPWGRPLDDTVVLILKTWTYAGTGYTPQTPGAQMALASADYARAYDQAVPAA